MSVFRSGLFSGKVAIVTGGGTGIGKAIATELLHLGKIWQFFSRCSPNVFTNFQFQSESKFSSFSAKGRVTDCPLSEKICISMTSVAEYYFSIYFLAK